MGPEARADRRFGVGGRAERSAPPTRELRINGRQVDPRHRRQPRRRCGLNLLSRHLHARLPASSPARRLVPSRLSGRPDRCRAGPIRRSRCLVTLTSTAGIGAITAGRLVGRTGRASRFPSSASFANYANYANAAPIEIASADKARHRLSRSGDRQLNAALHTVAIIQIRTPGSRGHTYYNAKIAQGKMPREARRCLKRRLADHIWHTMTADEWRMATGPGRHPGATLKSSAAGSTPTTSSSDKSLPEPARHDSTTPTQPLGKHRGTQRRRHDRRLGLPRRRRLRTQQPAYPRLSSPSRIIRRNPDQQHCFHRLTLPTAARMINA